MPETEKKMKQAYEMYKKRIGKGSSRMSYQMFKDNYHKTRAKTEKINPRRKKVKKNRTNAVKRGMKSSGVDWDKERKLLRKRRTGK